MREMSSEEESKIFGPNEKEGLKQIITGISEILLMDLRESTRNYLREHCVNVPLEGDLERFPEDQLTIICRMGEQI